MKSNYKPVGGVESCTLYPADAVETAIFSSRGCEMQLCGEGVEVPLLEDSSRYEEESRSRDGVVKVSHLLHLVADRKEAEEWLDNNLLERLAIEGAVAVVTLEDGRRLLAGYSPHLGNEQPLRLESLISTSGSNLHDRPTVTLRLVSHDIEFSSEIL